MSSSTASAAPNICCWLCGFPIGNNYGFFPGTSLRTGEGYLSGHAVGFWGTGVGEHILPALPGFGFVGIYQRSYRQLNNTAAERNEKEFLKREIRWAHQYCNAIKWHYSMLTFKNNTLEIIPKLISYIVKDIYFGNLRVSPERRPQRLDGEYSVTHNEIQHSNLIHYFINHCGMAPSVWISIRIGEITRILTDYINCVHDHMDNYSVTRFNVYKFRIQNTDPSNPNIRKYQQLPTDICPTVNCLCDSAAGGGGGGGGGGSEIIRPDEINASQDAYNDIERTLSGDVLAAAPAAAAPAAAAPAAAAPAAAAPVAAASAAASAAAPHHAYSIGARQNAARRVAPNSNIRSVIEFEQLEGRKRNLVEKGGDCNAQVLALWGPHNNDDLVSEEISDARQAHLKEAEGRMVGRLLDAAAPAPAAATAPAPAAAAAPAPAAATAPAPAAATATPVLTTLHPASGDGYTQYTRSRRSPRRQNRKTRKNTKKLRKTRRRR